MKKIEVAIRERRLAAAQSALRGSGVLGGTSIAKVNTAILPVNERSVHVVAHD